MDWLGDYVMFCLTHGFGGWVLLALSLGALLIAVMAVLAGLAQAGRAFARGWRAAG